MIKRILLGYDGSPAAAVAADFAAELAQRYGAELHVLAVFRPPEFGTEVETEDMIEHGRRHSALILRGLKAKLAGGKVVATYESTVGHPSEQLLLYAERHGADHIVVGHRGHTGLGRWLLGSVARQVIVHAQCAVTVVRG